MKLEPHEKLAWKAYRKNIGKQWATKEGFREAYQGVWSSEVAFAKNHFDNCYETAIPENLRGYIDYEAFAKDLFNDYFSAERAAGGVYVFQNL